MPFLGPDSVRFAQLARLAQLTQPVSVIVVIWGLLFAALFSALQFSNQELSIISPWPGAV